VGEASATEKGIGKTKVELSIALVPVENDQVLDLHAARFGAARKQKVAAHERQRYPEYTIGHEQPRSGSLVEDPLLKQFRVEPSVNLVLVGSVAVRLKRGDQRADLGREDD